MEIGTTSRFAALALLTVLLGAAFAVDRFAVATPNRAATQMRSALPLRAGPVE
jgi:uncharacterized membrane protein YphA (DoxX/SURF4 family)